MHTQLLNLEKFRRFKAQLKCIAVFLMLMVPYAGITFFLSDNEWVFGINLFISGWLIWTFIEYIVHRFWMHDTPLEKAKPVAEYHMIHHRQPTEMDINTLHRILVWILAGVLLLASIYFTICLMPMAGFVFGFTCYTNMHWVLHQSWSVKIIPRLHRFHLYHHCKYPNSCYGVTVLWWDLVFKTTPPNEPVLVKRVTDFYFGKEPAARGRQSVDRKP
jgi:sterol desaturase/sphingolipid hydroxylase (fatty acid hydroxylase superfamily)